jgi:hypothetical protein
MSVAPTTRAPTTRAPPEAAPEDISLDGLIRDERGVRLAPETED